MTSPEQDPEFSTPPTRDESVLSPKKTIYLLPNLFTTGALFFGFYAIVSAGWGHYDNAAIAIFIAMILDSVDGRVARMTNTESAFGAQYDSLSDAVSFGVAPALVLHSWGLSQLGKIGWIAAFFYTAATTLRLARFNIQLEVQDKKYFQGLPCPAAAGVVASMVWFFHLAEINHTWVIKLVALFSTIIALLMVSNVKYYSFKEFNIKHRVPFIAILGIVLFFVFVSLDPPSALLVLFGSYALSGPFMLWRSKGGRGDLLGS